jgi:hypothetical protein
MISRRRRREKKEEEKEESAAEEGENSRYSSRESVLFQVYKQDVKEFPLNVQKPQTSFFYPTQRLYQGRGMMVV